MLDLKYIAGLFDGEGTIFSINTNKLPSDIIFSIRVKIVNRNKKVLEEIKNEFGGIINLNPNKKPCYELVFRKKEAELFLLSIKEYLFIKKELAEIALEFYRVQKSGRNRPLTKEQHDERYSLCKKITELNKL